MWSTAWRFMAGVWERERPEPFPFSQRRDTGESTAEARDVSADLTWCHTPSHWARSLFCVVVKLASGFVLPGVLHTVRMNVKEFSDFKVFYILTCVRCRTQEEEEEEGKGGLSDVLMMTTWGTLTTTLLAFTRTAVPETTTMKIRRVTIATAITPSLTNPEEARLTAG